MQRTAVRCHNLGVLEQCSVSRSCQSRTNARLTLFFFFRINRLVVIHSPISHNNAIQADLLLSFEYLRLDHSTRFVPDTEVVRHQLAQQELEGSAALSYEEYLRRLTQAVDTEVSDFIELRISVKGFGQMV